MAVHRTMACTVANRATALLAPSGITATHLAKPVFGKSSGFGVLR